MRLCSSLNWNFVSVGVVFAQPKTRKSGASVKAYRRDKKTDVRVSEVLKYALKLAAVAAAAAVITAGLIWFDPKEKLQQLSGKPIDEVKLEGSFQFLSKDEARVLVASLVQGTFIDLDIAKLKQQLEQNPWIDSVIISREWPDKLIVRVVEQHPIAQWGKKGFLNMRGDIIEVEKTAKIHTLPFLNGEDHYAKEIMQQYLQMNKLLTPHDLNLSSVMLDKTKAWRVELSDGVVIKLGRERILQKLQALAVAKSKVLKDDFNKIESIDMRYPSGFAVMWQDQEKAYMAHDSEPH